MANYIYQKLAEGMAQSENVVYPKMQTYSTYDLKGIIEKIKNGSNTINGTTLTQAVGVLIEVMKNEMPMGHRIKIDGLGVFSLSLGYVDESPATEPAEGNNQSQTSETGDAAKVKYKNICIKGINFKPDPKLLSDMNRDAKFERVMPGVKTPKKSTLTRNERIAKALEIIDEKGFMTLSEYAFATLQCRSNASKDLGEITNDPTSGITSQGKSSHKIWVKN